MLDLKERDMVLQSSEKKIVNETIKKEKIILDELFLEKNEFLSLKRSLQRHGMNEEFRAIKHEIMSNILKPDFQDFNTKNFILLTSAFPNAGKTFCAINLSLMLSLEKDKSVLLIDADVLKPSVLKRLGVNNLPGLIDYLAGDINSIDDVIYETSIPNLKILPAGKVNSLSYELLVSDKMLELTEELAQKHQNDVVIFDGPPVLGIIETVSLSELVGQVIIVAEHNKTKLSEIKQTISVLHHNLYTGLIINKSIDPSLGKYGYGYGYGYVNEKKL